MAFAYLFVFSLVVPIAAQAAGLPDGTLMSGEDKASIYYLVQGKRLAFPSPEILQSWYPTLPEVKTVPTEQLASYPLRQNVTYRPGNRLVTFMSGSTVYAVARSGILRAIINDNLAAQLFGQNWRQLTETLPVTLFPNYQIGAPINSVTDYRPEQERSVNTILENIARSSEVIPIIPTTPPLPLSPPATLSVHTNAHHAVLNQTVTITVEVVSSTEAMPQLEIYDNLHQGPIASCLNASSCSKTMTMLQAPVSLKYWARAIDTAGRQLESSKEEHALVDVADTSPLITMTALPTSIHAGETSHYTFNANVPTQIKSHRIMALVPGETGPVVWQDCEMNQLCSATAPFYRTTQLYSVVQTAETTYQSGALTISVTEGSAPTPVLTLIPSTQKNEATLHLQAPSGPTIGWSMIVDGSHEDDTPLGICEKATCDLRIQFKGVHTYRAFTDVGGKLEVSNLVHASY